MNRTITITCFAAIFAVAVVFSPALTPVHAQEEQPAPVIITLQDPPAGIMPEKSEITRDQTIVFFNSGTGPASVKFITKLGLACAAPVNFYADLSGYYESTLIAEKATASICLIREGEYEFEVRRLEVVKDEKQEPAVYISTGKIIVK